MDEWVKQMHDQGAMADLTPRRPGFMSCEKPKVNNLLQNLTEEFWCINKTNLRLSHNIEHMLERFSGSKTLCVAGIRTCWTAGSI